MEESNTELESFRQKWKEEVLARTKADGRKASSAEPFISSRRPQPSPRLGRDKALNHSEDDNEFVTPQASHSLAGPSSVPGDELEGDFISKRTSEEPQSALEHYEKAVEREVQGSLGDSLNLYRKAFKVDL